MTRAKPSNKGKKSAKKASVKYCKVCKRSHGRTVNHRCLIAGTTKVVRYVMANNLSAAVFDNSSSGSEASPPTPREASDTDLTTSTQRASSAEATALPPDNTSHVRNLFTNTVHNSPITEPTAQASHDMSHNPQPVSHSQPTAGATQTNDTSGDQPTSGITITTNNPSIPSGVTSNVLTTDRQNFPPGGTTSNMVEPPRFSFQANTMPAAPNMCIATLLSTLRAAKGAAANYDPNAAPATRAQPAPRPPRPSVSFAPSNIATPQLPTGPRLAPPNPAPTPSVSFSTPSSESVPLPTTVVTNPLSLAQPAARQHSGYSPDINTAAPITRQEVQALFADFTDTLKVQLTNDFPWAYQPVTPTQPLQVTPTPVLPPVLTPIQDTPPVDCFSLPPPQLTPVKLTPTQNPALDFERLPTSEEPKRNVAQQNNNIPNQNTTQASFPLMGPMGATPLKKRSCMQRKRSHAADSSPSPSDSGSDSDYGHKKSKKAKSGAFRTYSDRVKYTFWWPNKYVGRSDGTSPTYDQLTYSELVAGIFRGLVRQLPQYPCNRSIEQQLRYYGEMFFEAPGSAFDDAKTAHRTVLEALEKAELTSPQWEDWDVKRQQVLTRLHRTAPLPSKPNSSANSNNNKGKPKNSAKKPTPCDNWNAGTCDNPASR